MKNISDDDLSFFAAIFSETVFNELYFRDFRKSLGQLIRADQYLQRKL